MSILIKRLHYLPSQKPGRVVPLGVGTERMLGNCSNPAISVGAITRHSYVHSNPKNTHSQISYKTVHKHFHLMSSGWFPFVMCRKNLYPSNYLSDLQYCLDLGGDVSLLIEFDALFMCPGWALDHDLLQVSQHHTVGLGHCFKLLKQQLQQFPQEPIEGARESTMEWWKCKAQSEKWKTADVILLSLTNNQFRVHKQYLSIYWKINNSQ